MAFILSESCSQSQFMEGCKKQTKGEYGKETLGQIKDDEANKIWTFKTFFLM